jgi:hypothetical protein
LIPEHTYDFISSFFFKIRYNRIADGQTKEEKPKVNNTPRQSYRRCDVTGIEMNKELMWMIALCANVEVAEREGTIAVVEEVVLEIAKVELVVVGAMVRTEMRQAHYYR